MIKAHLSRDDVEILNKTTLSEGYYTLKKYLLRYKLFAGDWGEQVERELLIRDQVAGALPYDPSLDKVVLIEQFRVGSIADERSPWLIEIVAGVVEDNETIEQMVQRESQEEADITALELEPICNYWVSPGATTERFALYCAKVDASQAGGICGVAAEHEDIRVFTLDVKEAFEAVQSGIINNAPAIIALQWLQIHHKKLRQRWLGNNL